MSHDIACEEHPREFVFHAVCECGHVAEGPNPAAARTRHAVHVHIEEARAALKEGKTNGG